MANSSLHYTIYRHSACVILNNNLAHYALN